MAQAEYQRRTEKVRALMEQVGIDGLLVASQYNRRYLTGFSPTDGDITESSGWALLTAKSLYLITGTFHLTGLEPEIEPSEAAVLLTDQAPSTKVLAAAMEREGIRRLGFEQQWLSYDRYVRIRGALDGTGELVPMHDLVEQVRARKDEVEISIMRRAADIAYRAFAQLMTEIRVGMTERQVAFRLDALMRESGAEGPSFPTIVACGPGGALPHAVPGDRELTPGEPLLIDFGCRVDGYCSDQTRTVCLGEPTPKLKEIYGIVRAAQDAAERALREGARRGRDIDGAARQVIVDAGYGEQFIHSTGHGVGLAVHELPYVASPRTSDPAADAELAAMEGIAPGMVITNEPGIYLPGWGGVRLEDMLVAREDGVEVLTVRNPENIFSIGLE